MKKPLLALLGMALLLAVFMLGRATNDDEQPADEQAQGEATIEAQPSAQTAVTGTPTPAQTAESTPIPSIGLEWTFDGTPGQPLAFNQHPDSLDFDVQVHSRNQPSWGDDALPAKSYDHGDDCSGSKDWRSFPQHTNTSYEGAAFICNDHLMTANAGSGYGAVVLTPNRLLDLSQGGEVTVSLRMSTFRQSDRDWVEFNFSPWDGNNAIPCRFCPDLQGNPVQSVMLNMSQEKIEGGKTGTGFVLYVNGQQISGTCPCYESVLEPDKARRDLVEIVISDSHLVMRMPEYDLTLVDASFDPLGWDKAIFQLIHHSYDPEKGDKMHGEKAAANTWHWDEIGISPSTSFEILKSDTRALLSEGPGDLGSMNFERPAPKNAYLRFAAFANPDVSFDGGATWTRAEPQPSTKKQVATDTYFLPIPAGTQQVAFRANCVEWYCDEMHVKDASIWALGDQVTAPAAALVEPTQAISPPTTGTAGLALFRCDLGSGLSQR